MSLGGRTRMRSSLSVYTVDWWNTCGVYRDLVWETMIHEQNESLCDSVNIMVWRGWDVQVVVTGGVLLEYLEDGVTSGEMILTQWFHIKFMVCPSREVDLLDVGATDRVWTGGGVVVAHTVIKERHVTWRTGQLSIITSIEEESSTTRMTEDHRVGDVGIKRRDDFGHFETNMDVYSWSEHLCVSTVARVTRGYCGGFD
ncbi:hypothetical protein Tco_0168533 [Tanacetum coccineum]